MFRLGRSAPPQQVLLLLREVISEDPTQCGPDHPIIGAVLAEDEAIRLEHENPSIGFCWETFPLLGAVAGSTPESVWVASEQCIADGGVDDVLDDPSPRAVFGTVDAARAWVRRSRGEHVILEVPVGGADASAPRWRVEQRDSPGSREGRRRGRCSRSRKVRYRRGG